LNSKEPICIEYDSLKPSMKKKMIGVSSSPIDFLLQLAEAVEKLEAKNINHTKNKKRKQGHGK